MTKDKIVRILKKPLDPKEKAMAERDFADRTEENRDREEPVYRDGSAVNECWNSKNYES